MRLLQDQLKRTHSVFEFVAFKSLRLDRIDTMQNLLEAVLKIFNTLSVDFFDFLTFFCQFGSIFACNSLNGDTGLVNKRLDA